MLILLLAGSALAGEPVPSRGMYGLPSVDAIDPERLLPALQKAGIRVVFVPAHAKTVRWYKAHGFRVYASINVFGGKGAWRRFPASRPVQADGRMLEETGSGGVCPTHAAWREDRKERLRDLVSRLGGKDGIDGIWLDFVRYPGEWERKEPAIPDTCYCERCLRRFQRETGVALPLKGKGPEAAAAWIRVHERHAWMVWKKEQIASFIRAAREIVGDLTLGLFVVPWRKGEYGNTVSYDLAQDAEDLSRFVDVISPMTYHVMCGRSASWVGDVTRYFQETSSCAVWPIVQSMDVRPEALEEALRSAADAMADGVLVFHMRAMNPSLWHAMEGVARPSNLLPDISPPGSGEGGVPEEWSHGETDPNNPDRSRFFVGRAEALSLREGARALPSDVTCIGITTGNDGQGVWEAPLPACRAGDTFAFTAHLYRERWENDRYARARIWGREHRLDTHLLTRAFQPVTLRIRCPEDQAEPVFRFVNPDPEETYWLCRPAVRRRTESVPTPERARTFQALYEDFFPIGVYGATRENLGVIKRLALNTVLIGGSGEDLRRTVAACHETGLRYVVAVPRDPDRLVPFLDEIKSYVEPRNLAFYVNDEPGIHAFPKGRAEDIQRLIKRRFPDAATCMAVVRPQVCADYDHAADVFMMDQYPVPFQPMTWLSDSMDRAARDVGRGRLAAVIQAFGGAKWARVGWPRLPTWREMDCLAFLSVVHGSRGVLFFSFREIGATPEGREGLGRVVGRLNRVYPWLVRENEKADVGVEMISDCRVDPKGRPAVHACLKKKGEEMLVLAVNTIHVPVETVLSVPGMEGTGVVYGEEVFSGIRVRMKTGRVRARLEPFGVKGFNVPVCR